MPRLYARSQGAPAIAPQFDAWDETTGMARRPGDRAPAGTPMQAFNCWSSATTASKLYGIAQIIFGPLEAQLIKPGFMRGQIRASELGTQGNFDRVAQSLRVVSADGLTNRGHIVPLGTYAPALEFPVGTPTNRGISDWDPTLQVLAHQGDWLVWELGARNATAVALDIFASLVLGDNGVSDLPQDTTSTAPLNAWLELSSGIDFLGDPLPAEAKELRIGDIWFAQLQTIGTPASSWLTPAGADLLVHEGSFVPKDALPRHPEAQIYFEHIGTEPRPPRSRDDPDPLNLHAFRTHYRVWLVIADPRQKEGRRKLVNLKADVLRALFFGENAIQAIADHGMWPGAYAPQEEAAERAGAHVAIQDVWAEYDVSHGSDP